MNAMQMKARSSLKGKTDENGINMVDLIMWLVIAALLLAAALQGIGYYQKASNVYVLKNDLNNAAAVAHAQASLMNGTIDDAALNATLTQTTLTNGTVLSYGTTSVYAAGAVQQPGDAPYGFERSSVVASINGLAYVMTATNPAYPDTTVYLYFEKTAGTSDGIVVGSPGSEPVTIINTTATATDTSTATATASPTPTATVAPVVIAPTRITAFPATLDNNGLMNVTIQGTSAPNTSVKVTMAASNYVAPGTSRSYIRDVPADASGNWSLSNFDVSYFRSGPVNYIAEGSNLANDTAQVDIDRDRDTKSGYITYTGTATTISFPAVASDCQVAGVAFGTEVQLKVNSTAPGCNLGVNGATLASGMKWGNPNSSTTCDTNTDLATPLAILSGTSIPNSACTNITNNWKATITNGGTVTVRLPVFNQINSTTAGLVRYADFVVTGWNFSGNYFHNASPYATSADALSGTSYGLIGHFTSSYQTVVQ